MAQHASPTRRSCSARWKARRPIRTIRRPDAARRRRVATTRVPESRRAEGRAHRHSARVLLRHARRCRATRAARRTEPTRRRRSMDEAIAVLKQQGAVIVDPADIPSVVDQDREEQLPAVGHLLGRGRREGQGRRLLGRVQVRHEARLQRVARVARRRRAGEVADRAARVEHGARSRRARSSTASRSSTSPTRWTSRRDRARYEADRAKDIALAGDAWHRRGDEGAASRRAAVSRARAARHRRASRAIRRSSCPFATGAERADAARFPAGSTRSRRRSASASPARPAASRG